MNKLFTTATALAFVFAASSAFADENTDKLKKIATEKITSWVQNSVVVKAITDQNSRHASLGQADIDKMDKTWRAETKAKSRPMIEKILADLPRPGAPPIFTAEQVCQLMALACRKPEELGLPFTTWTPSELARSAVQEGIVTSISSASVGRFLKSGRFAAP